MSTDYTPPPRVPRTDPPYYRPPWMRDLEATTIEARYNDRDGRQFYRHNGHDDELLARVLADLPLLPELAASTRIEDRLRAGELVQLAEWGITLPAGTWCVLERSNPFGDSYESVNVWSAHHTEEDARAWHKVWQEREARKQYPRSCTVEQYDHAPLHTLRAAGYLPEVQP